VNFDSSEGQYRGAAPTPGAPASRFDRGYDATKASVSAVVRVA